MLRITPALIPRTNLPKHICQKLRNMHRIDPSKPTQLNLIRVLLLPYLMKSPPNIDPNEIPTIADVVKMVELNSIITGSQFS